MKNKFVLCSKSLLKKKALLNSNDEVFGPFDVHSIEGNKTETEQPFTIENTFKCARKRIEGIDNHRFVIAIENGIFRNKYGFLQDICAIVIKDNETNRIFDNKENILNTAIMIPDAEILFNEIEKAGKSDNDLGYKLTFGELLSKKYEVPHNNWMKDLCNFPRERQIKIAFNDIYCRNLWLQSSIVPLLNN